MATRTHITRTPRHSHVPVHIHYLHITQIATGFVAHGAKVYITSRDKKACDETAKELNKMGKGSCVAIPADLSKLSEVERLVKELSQKEDSKSLSPEFHIRLLNHLPASQNYIFSSTMQAPPGVHP